MSSLLASIYFWTFELLAICPLSLRDMSIGVYLSLFLTFARCVPIVGLGGMSTRQVAFTAPEREAQRPATRLRCRKHSEKHRPPPGLQQPLAAATTGNNNGASNGTAAPKKSKGAAAEKSLQHEGENIKAKSSGNRISKAAQIAADDEAEDEAQLAGRKLWTCVACTFGNGPDQDLCEAHHSPKENAKFAPAAAGVASAEKKKASKPNGSKAAAATAVLESSPSATAAKAGVVNTCLATGVGHTAKGLEGLRIAADSGFYTKQEFSSFTRAFRSGQRSSLRATAPTTSRASATRAISAATSTRAIHPEALKQLRLC